MNDRMTNSIYTDPETWQGGAFDILLYLGPSSDERIRHVLVELWQAPLVRGCWYETAVAPHEMARVTLEQVPLDDLWRLYGLARLPDGQWCPCASTLVRDDDGAWIYFGVPLGGLGHFFDIGTYPFEPLPLDEHRHQAWIVPLSNWLADVGHIVFSAEPFEVAVTGLLTLFEVQESLHLRTGEVPERRWNGYLKRAGTHLAWYPPNRFDGPSAIEQILL